MTIIRKGVPEDAEAVAKVHASSWRTTYHEIVDEEFLNNFVWEKRHDKWKKMLQDDHTKVVLVVESKGSIFRQSLTHR